MDFVRLLAYKRAMTLTHGVTAGLVTASRFTRLAALNSAQLGQA
jgi:hypothetical protein